MAFLVAPLDDLCKFLEKFLNVDGKMEQPSQTSSEVLNSIFQKTQEVIFFSIFLFKILFKILFLANNNF